MRRPLIALILGMVLPTVILFSVTRKVRAAGPTFTTIDFPGACATIATAINYSATIVGDFAPTCKLPEVLRVNATPTLILVDSDGRVERSWIGLLDPAEQLELFKTAFGPGTTVQSKE